MDKLLIFLRFCISNPLLPLSWGMANIVIKEDYVAFTVNGIKYQGLVEVRREFENLKVVLGNATMIFIDASNMLTWLDENIE